MSRRKIGTDLLPCAICGRDFPTSEAMPAEAIRPSVLQLIAHDHADFGPGHFICHADLNRYRYAYVEELLASERGAITSIEQEVLRSLRDQETVAQDINLEFQRQITFGEGVADRLASFGGSWTFIIIFFCLITAWMLLNSAQLIWKPFDRYPFILLNLVLSCLAALQAPVIMMSQKRQEARDRLRAEQDFRTNLKAELEIRYLNTKVDQLLSHQWAHLMEIQQIQMELTEELMNRLPERRD
jgi:uncharacterized membrane protein